MPLVLEKQCADGTKENDKIQNLLSFRRVKVDDKCMFCENNSFQELMVCEECAEKFYDWNWKNNHIQGGS